MNGIGVAGMTNQSMMSMMSRVGNIGGGGPHQALQKADADGSGTVDQAEFSEMTKADPTGGSDDATKAFSKLDADGNGELTKAEMKDGMKSIMNAMQGNQSTFSMSGQSSMPNIFGDPRDSSFAATDFSSDPAAMFDQLMEQLQSQQEEQEQTEKLWLKA